MKRETMLARIERAYARVSFYTDGMLRDLVPYRYHVAVREKLFTGLGDTLDPAIVDRVRYYNKLERDTVLTAQGRIDAIPLAHSYYYYDLKRHAKAFRNDLRLAYLFGDITHVPAEPAIVKSRPIGDHNTNSVVMKLDRLRHYRWPGDRLAFEEKSPTAVWRGGASNPARRALLKNYASHPDFDIGHTGKPFDGIAPKRWLSAQEQLEHRYVISVEGNDVATNLKWILASNSLCLTRPLRFETWFMEGRLRPGVHYVSLNDDLSDVEDKVAYYERHPQEARQIIRNAQAFAAQFLDQRREDLISLLVLHKYFVATGQCPAEPFTDQLFGTR